jgi:hypothetical protein
MKEPGKKRKFSIIDLILILLFIIMIFALYILFEGDFAALTRPGTYTAGESPFDQIVGSLSALGQGISNAFSGWMR